MSKSIVGGVIIKALSTKHSTCLTKFHESLFRFPDDAPFAIDTNPMFHIKINELIFFKLCIDNVISMCLDKEESGTHGAITYFSIIYNILGVSFKKPTASI